MREDVIDWLLPQLTTEGLRELRDADWAANGSPSPETMLHRKLMSTYDVAALAEKAKRLARIEPGYKPRYESGTLVFLTDDLGRCYEPIEVQAFGEAEPRYLPGKRIA